MKRLAILLTVFNRKEKTLHCLENINKCSKPADIALDIFITNDGCTDGTSDAIRDRFPTVKIIDGDGSLFWNRGMFTAWKEAAQFCYDYYLWLNDDTFIYDNIFEILLGVANDIDDNGAIVGATCVPNTQIVSYGGRLINGHAVQPNGKILDVKLANGNILLIPKRVFDVVGLMDPYYRHDKGDSDYSLMVQEKGFRLVQAPCFLGECDRHANIPTWMNPKVPFIKRWIALYSVMGPQPKEVFYFEKKHFGYKQAIKKVISTYLRCFLPNFWIWIGKEKQLYGIQTD